MQKKSILIAMFWVLAAVLLPVSSTSFAATIVPAGQRATPNAISPSTELCITA